jgi:ubiquinone/menaquinone biosynthesis C-methylase UbiE
VVSVDLTQLDIAARARHLANPEGEIGLAIAKTLNSMNAQVIALAFSTVAPDNGNRILEIGFGNGHTVPRLLKLAERLTYAGIDISETMVDEATRFSSALIADRRVDLRVGTSSRIPFPNAAFDRTLAVNTLYFWSDPAVDLKEIRRVLKPGGTLVLGSLSPSSAQADPMFKHGFRFLSQQELIDLLRNAGFSEVSIDVHREIRKMQNGNSYKGEYFITSAS